MNWEQTVIPTLGAKHDQALKNAQAEALFKAGQGEGRREVVEWVEERIFPDPRIGVTPELLDIKISPTLWKDQLKDWCIE